MGFGSSQEPILPDRKCSVKVLRRGRVGRIFVAMRAQGSLRRVNPRYIPIQKATSADRNQPPLLIGEVSVGWDDAIQAVLLWLAAGGASPQTLRLRYYQFQRLAQSVTCAPWEIQLSDLL